MEEEEVLPEEGEEGGRLGERRPERSETTTESKGVEDDADKSKEKVKDREWRKVRRGVKWWMEFSEGQHSEWQAPPLRAQNSS